MLKQDALKISLIELYGKLGSSERGITQKEAAKRLQADGPNVLKKKGIGALTVLVRQFQSSLIYLLIAASAICYWIRDWSDGTVILVILLINTSLGFFQEYRSEKIIEKLSKFISHQVRVKRDDTISLLDESQIVPGDVIVVREGDIAPADMRLITADDLQVNESQLTGESMPVMKRVVADAAQDSLCLIFTGSVIEKGEGVGVIYATGGDTEFGAIAKLSTDTKKETQYEKSLQSFSSFLMKIVLGGLALVFIFKLILEHGFSNFVGLLLFIIALAVAVVPEVLPVIATVTLSSGALKLAKKHVVVKRLSSLEDLGNVTLLCTDKTGTLTENKMVISKIASVDDTLFQIFSYAAIVPIKNRKRRTQNSYDDAFINYIPEAIKAEAKHFSIVKELPFDPEDKRSRTILEDTRNKKYYLLSIGAPEALVKISAGGHEAEYLRDIVTEGTQGLHHLAISYKEIAYDDDFDILKNENHLIFLGYASMEDPLRASAKETIKLAEKLGVKLKILTGDGREVAEFIGRQVGLVTDGDVVYLGDELDAMSEQQFNEAVQKYNVFARVSPTQKYNIIKALKETDIVGYQGDGINDAPALKLAHVAIAVNSAMDIAKENADIVLLNKSLEVIINGIKYGRSIFVNINKYIKFTMVSNFGNFIALAVLYLMSSGLPMLPIQVLLTSVLTDLPLITVSSDTVEDGEVVRPEKHDTRDLLLISLILGIPTALFEIFYFLMIRFEPQPYVATCLYVFFTFLALIIFYAIRNKENFWKTKQPSTLLNISFLITFVVSIAVVYIPIFQKWFSFVPLSISSVMIILVLMVVYFIAADYVKVWYYRRGSFSKPSGITE
jgi:Mg2+-importing ATPase